jgi:hypothetical protein
MHNCFSVASFIGLQYGGLEYDIFLMPNDMSTR